MKALLKKLAFTGVLTLAAGAASAGVTVKYIEPDNFADLPYSSAERKQVLRELTAHFDKLGARLPQGQELVVEVTDIDLAGRKFPNQPSGQDMRVMRGLGDAPSMNLRYALVQDGKVVRVGDAALTDTTYAQRVGRFANSDPLRTEKRMIADWFTIATAQQVAAR